MIQVGIENLFIQKNALFLSYALLEKYRNLMKSILKKTDNWYKNGHTAKDGCHKQSI